MRILKDKVIIVTGGSGLIGKAIVKNLFDKGADVINLDLVKSDELPCKTIECDITKIEELPLVINEALSSYNRLDGLVNNAYPRTKDWGTPFEDIKLSSWRNNVDMQLSSIAMLIQKVIPYLRKSDQASVVNIASIYGVVGNDFSLYKGTGITPPAEYSAIKGGLVNFTRYLASLYGNENIRVNCVSPGGIFDDQPQKFVDRYEEKVPLSRLGRPEDIPPAVSFLLSSEAGYITGHNLVVDGGWTAI